MNRTITCAFALAAAALFSASTVSAGGLPTFVAEQVTIGNAGTHLFQGSDADGGIDDWRLSNGIVEAIIDDVGPQVIPGLVGPPEKSSEFSPAGGTLIDLGLVGQNNDQLSQMFTVGGLSTSNFILYDTVSGSTTASSATITATGELQGFGPGAPPSNLPVTTTYSLGAGDNFLTIITTVTNTGGTTAPGFGGYLDAFIWTIRSLVPFSPLPGLGFTHAELNLSSPGLELPLFFAAPGALSDEDGVIDPESGVSAGAVSYGYLGVETTRDADGAGGNPPVVTAVDRLFGINGNTLTAFGNFPTQTLTPGAIVSYERRIYVGSANDVAAVSNDILPELGSRLSFSTGTISGDVGADDATDVEAAATVVRTGGPAILSLSNGSFVTHFRTDATGAFSGVVLPEGTYDVTFKSPERDDVTATGIVVTASSDTPVTVPSMSAQATVNFILEEKIDGGKVTVPGRATFIGEGATSNPVFNDYIDALITSGSGDSDLAEHTFAGGLAQGNVIYLADGTGSVNVRPGTYTIYASRGPEYSIKRKKIKLKAGATKRVKLKLRRILETPDAISADFHIHSARSMDTSPPLEDRVVTFVGEQVEVMVSTDHDYHTDYTSIISSLGLSDRVTSIVGNEVTGSNANPPAWPDSTGHINAWPVLVNPDARRDGAIEDELIAPNLIFSRLRAQGADVIQYNHVRAGVSGVTSIGFFNNFGYDPDLPITSPPNDILLDDDVLGPGISGVSNPDGLRNIDFNVLEIMNETDMEPYLEVRRDWFSLLNQLDGTTVPFIGGTAVSDSHRLTVETAGYGRTYVLGVGDDPATLDKDALNTAVVNGKMVGTTGPYIEFSLSDAPWRVAQIGETLPATGNDVTLHIKVQSAHWIPVDEVRVYINGFLHSTFDPSTDPKVTLPRKATSASRKVTRFEADVDVTLTGDSWVIVEAGASIDPLATADDFFASTIVPGLVPIAFTNPIFVDTDANGFDAPGLPVEANPTPRSARVASLEGFDLDSLSDKKREEVLGHFPWKKVRIAQEDVDALMD